jgi:hypothetical protein
MNKPIVVLLIPYEVNIRLGFGLDDNDYCFPSKATDI